MHEQTIAVKGEFQSEILKIKALFFCVCLLACFHCADIKSSDFIPCPQAFDSSFLGGYRWSFEVVLGLSEQIQQWF